MSHKVGFGLLIAVAALCLRLQAADKVDGNSAANVFPTVGAVHGITRGPNGLPLASVNVIVHSVERSNNRTLVSGADGAFYIANLQPGAYRLTASLEGFESSPVFTLQLAISQTVTVDLILGPKIVNTCPSCSTALFKRLGQVAASPLPQNLLASAASPGSSAAAPAPEPAPTAEDYKALVKRIEQLEAERRDRTTPQPPPSATPAGGKPTEVASALPPPNQQSASTDGSIQKEAPVGPITAVDMQTPFADHDWTWLNGNSRQHDSLLDSKYFTGEFRSDTHYGIDTNQPRDHSMGGSSEVFRNGEVQLEDLSIGGDFHAGNVRGRLLGLFGMFSSTTVRNDASPAVGQWDVRAAYKYVSEAYGGYHFNVNHGLNVDAGIFVSYVGLFSYHNYDNWAYQPSYVSSNTPWFFNGVRVQWFPTNHLKIEPWFINGWQSYNRFNGHPGLGGQLKWTPNGWFELVANQYGVGNDNIGLTHRGRYHTDDSIQIKYYDKPKPGNGINRMAFSLTGDAGCETGDGVTCHGGKGGPKQSFLGYMAYNRFWWHKDLFGLTLGGGQINNPGRYLTLVLPVNGADAISGTPYFPAYPGAPFKAWDTTATFDWMPSQFFTFRTEFGYRHSNVPYFSGRGGITPPGGNNGSPADYVCSSGLSSGVTDLTAAQAACGGGPGSVWMPDLRKGQGLFMFSILVKL